MLVKNTDQRSAHTCELKSNMRIHTEKAKVFTVIKVLSIDNLIQ